MRCTFHSRFPRRGTMGEIAGNRFAPGLHLKNSRHGSAKQPGGRKILRKPGPLRCPKKSMGPRSETGLSSGEQWINKKEEYAKKALARLADKHETNSGVPALFQVVPPPFRVFSMLSKSRMDSPKRSRTSIPDSFSSFSVAGERCPIGGPSSSRPCSSGWRASGTGS